MFKFMNYENDKYDFEDWEADAFFLEKEDWPGLLKLRKDKAERYKDDLYAQQRLTEALILNEKFNEALDLITPLYLEYYELGFGIQEIIDALLGLGKSESDFKWIIEPKIARLNDKSLFLCTEFLRGKRKYRSIFDLYDLFLTQADYIMFNEEELTKFLIKQGELFDIKGDTNYYFDIEFKLR